VGNGLVIKIAEAGAGGREFSHEFGDQVFEIFTNADIYHYQSPREGVFGVVLDWAIITYISDIAGIASAIWLVYENVKNRNKNKEGIKGIYVDIDSEHGLHWLIGKDIKDKDIFINDFTERVSKFQASDSAGVMFERKVTQIKTRGVWVHKRRNNIE